MSDNSNLIEKSSSTEIIQQNQNSRRTIVLEASREFRNSQTIQQSILLGLLNNYCSITISQPAKKSTVTGQFIRVLSLDFGNGDEIQIDEFLKKRCSEQMKKDIEDGVSQKTALRRYQNNKKIEQIHLLMDILVEKGYRFQTRKMKGKLETKKLEMICSMQFQGKVFDIGEIAYKAEHVNMAIMKMLETNCKKVVIERQKIVTDLSL